ncbi:DUF6271 family protein [Streptomyces sp. NPDC006879]|uniref:DUF6271 family protein n=1 Tax=Streptomyces sp. NPDC006879 TaxID=3364767 RepID=UPI00369331FC
MRRICLTLPTNRACSDTIAALGEEAAYGARHFDAEVHLLILDSSDAEVFAAHQVAVNALPPVPEVIVHHLDERAQQDFLTEVIDRSGTAASQRLLTLMLPPHVSYGACTNRAFLFAEALGCTSVHRRDSDSRYQFLHGEPVFPLHHELGALGRPATEVADGVSRSRLDPAYAKWPVALVGGSFVGEMSVDVAEIRDLDPDIYQEVVGLAVPAGYPEIWRKNLIQESFRGAGSAPFTGDRTTLSRVNPMRVDMCNISFDREVYGRVPLPPATDTIGSDYFLIHLVHDAQLPGVVHNRHIVNYYTGERRTEAGFLAYQLRFAKFLLSAPYFHWIHTRLTAASPAITDDEGRIRPSAIADLVRDSTRLDRGANAERLDVLQHCYRKLGGRYGAAADALGVRRGELLDQAVRDMEDFAHLVDVWEVLSRNSRDLGLPWKP